MDKKKIALLTIAALLLEETTCDNNKEDKPQRSRRRTTTTTRSKRRRLWSHRHLLQRQAEDVNLCWELEIGDDVPPFEYFSRLFPDEFQLLEEMVKPFIQKKNTNYRDCISPRERLMVTLYFLATGKSFKSLSFQFRIGHSTLSHLIPETCRIIHQVLKDDYLKCPDSDEEWEEVARGFADTWNFPNCLGALDGKYLFIRPSPKAGPLYSTLKNPTLSLMALADSEYKILCVEVACDGVVSNGGTFTGCSLQDALESWIACMPAPASLPGCPQEVPYSVVADEAFPLKEHLLKPYTSRYLTKEDRVFNYRLSRAQRAVDNALGILTHRWRFLLTTMALKAEAAEHLVLACCALHNFLCETSREKYFGGSQIIDQEGPDYNMIPGEWRQDREMQQAALPTGTNITLRAKQNRDNLCQYFSSDGAVNFQWAMI